MSRPVGLGLLGCGQIASYHLRETITDARLRWVAVCDVRAEAAAERAAEFDIPGCYTELDDLLADPAVDAVVVATSPVAHVQPTIRAFEAGKHVLVEKPLAIDAGEAAAMLAAQRDGLVGACCSCRFRAADGARQAAALLASGQLGAVQRLVADVAMPAPEDYDGTQPFFLDRPMWGGQGVLADWGCYDLDYLFGLTGWTLVPQVVLADTRLVPAVYRALAAPRNDVEVQVGAHALLTGGAVLDYRRASFAAAEPHARWWIEAEHGTLDLCLLPGAPQVVLRRLTAQGVVSEPLVATADSWSDVMGGPVRDFVQAIVDGRPPLTPLAEAARLQRLTDAIYTSAATGQAVSLAW